MTRSHKDDRGNEIDVGVTRRGLIYVSMSDNEGHVNGMWLTKETVRELFGEYVDEARRVS